MTPDQIRLIILKAIFSNEELEEILTLKGGNALKLYGVTERQSQDLDFSIKETVRLSKNRHEGLFYSVLESEFEKNHYKLINFRFTEVPSKRQDNIPDFWGGYKIEFSIIHTNKFDQLSKSQLKNINAFAESIEGDKKRIQIDLSFDEYTDTRQAKEVDGVSIYLYTPLMIVYEKIRASCQQLPDYHLSRDKKRSRDLYDIYILLSNIKYITLYDEILNPDNFYILEKMFSLKNVDIDLIPKIPTIKEELEHDYHTRVLPQIPVDQSSPSFQFLFEYTTELFSELYQNVIKKRKK